MKREDERIMEYLGEHGSASARLIAREAFEQVSAGHVSERLEHLRYAGLVCCLGLDSYELTGEGQRYLAGDVDAAHQPTPTVDRVLRG
jgi:Mn-dependent DtxR family transcriptional regulator